METKEQFKNRLKNEGRWNDFIQYREKLKAGGHDAKSAWAKARQKFQPVSDGASLAENNSDDDTILPAGDTVCMDNFCDKPPVTARAVVQWVFDHIDIADVKPEDAPSAGAWSFLQRVRTYPDLLKEFYRTIWAKMLPTRSEIEAREKFEDDGREQLHLIEQIQRARDKANGG
ncbi:MAG: hypothetical protein BWY69_00109 [Planctomycetes bacterium ADurb.Bin401]|nr:MAG: hypothetical protein BWY69_00109 [Planctomycetes bacterium ADurb.Bin401]